MATIKLTKTELKAQTDALKRFQRFLPMLQLKKQQLQGEIAGIVAKAEAVSAKEQSVRRSLEAWVGLFASGEDLLGGLVTLLGLILAFYIQPARVWAIRGEEGWTIHGVSRKGGALFKDRLARAVKEDSNASS